MSKKSKAASSSRVQAGAFGSTAFGGTGTSTFGASSGFASAAPPSQLSHVYEPPDLSTISDPATVVAWKNLQKRDGVTKEKALDELLAHVDRIEGEKQGLDDGFLEAWVRLLEFSSRQSCVCSSLVACSLVYRQGVSGRTFSNRYRVYRSSSTPASPLRMHDKYASVHTPCRAASQEFWGSAS